MENSICETIIKEITEEITQPGFDGQSSASLGTTVAPGTEGDSNTTDIAQQTPKVTFVKNAISKSLPYMMGYVQPMSGPAGFVFGVKQRKDTSVTHPSNLPNTVPTEPLDQLITRKLVETGIREVKLDFTNEVVQDIESLFGNNFGDYFEKFQKSGGEVWDGPNGEIARFFLDFGMQRMASKINEDFIQWLSTVATIKGQATISTYNDMATIYGIIGELRESLYKSTGKSGSCWILVTPKIAAFLSSTIGSTMNNSASVYNEGRRKASNKENGYVLTMGDIDVYQHDLYNSVTGGTSADSETSGEIYMGFTGGPGVSSIFYMPYKEYLVQGGENYMTGQSNVYYRVRDAWETNPLDTYDQSQVTVNMGSNTPDLTQTNKSQYVMKVNLSFSQQLIQS